MNVTIFKKPIIHFVLLSLLLQIAIPSGVVLAQDVEQEAIIPGDIILEEEASKEAEILENEVESESDAEDTEAEEEAVTATELESSAPEATLQYSTLMRRVRNLDPAEEEFRKPEMVSPFIFAAEERKEVQKQNLKNDIDLFIENEEIRLNDLGVSAKKQEAYLNRLRAQQKNLSLEGEDLDVEIERRRQIHLQEKDESRVPEKPSEFRFGDDAAPIRLLKIETIDGVPVDRIGGEPGRESNATLVKKTNGTPIINFNKNLISLLPQAHAAVPYTDLPIFADTQADGEEIQINSEIQTLAKSLNNNPVEIYNFVRNHITYEPYLGAKKGAIGCLHEAVCNDYDTASLTIALLRAAGIPARYKKVYGLVTIDQMKNLLGVEETRTVFAIFCLNKVPVYTISGNPIEGDTIDTYDFSGETQMVVEWILPELFYEYDERGGNITNELSFAEAQTDDDVRTVLQTYPKKQWIRLEPIIKPYTHTQNEIVHNTANFDTQTFWNGYFQYSGTQSPLEKYAADLLSATGKEITDPQYQSTNEAEQKRYDILPPKTPYALVEGTIGTEPIVTENWSTLPDTRRFKVVLSLKKNSDQSTVLSQSLYDTDINNIPLNLYYKGATQTDKDVIESYGGIHATPADLVDIVPYFSSNYSLYDGTGTGGGGAATPIEIGDSLTLEFEYFLNGQSIHSDQKFAVAGNNEGIYITLSRVAEDPFLDDESDLDQNSKILLEGNAEIARQYLRRVEQSSDLLSKTLDRNYNLNFLRAVVTQNRVLTEVGGTPTTFDFKGLTIDASAYILDYSNRGNYKTLANDFHLLWGLQASYDEAAIFEDITGMEAISTVQGLQYAYANPGTYTIHTIDSGNESTIDTLNLSANTKANMHADVQEGRTIITPNKAVTEGTFTGILYVSLDTDGTALYAIGEQSQGNGGWSIEGLSENIYCDETYCYINYQSIQGARIYLHEDKNKTSFNCTLTNQDFITLQNDPEWETSFGVPCHIPENNLQFGEIETSYKIATNATRFYKEGEPSPYWKKSSEIYTMLKDYADNHFTVYEPNYKFSKFLGTYMLNNLYDGAIYYAPFTHNGVQGGVFMVEGQIFEKAGANDNKIIKEMGYPTEDEGTAAMSGFGTLGTYQWFVNGIIYHVDDDNVYGKTYYVPGEINHYHVIHSGTGGKFGFPIGDPYYELTYWVQEFEGGKITPGQEIPFIYIKDSEGDEKYNFLIINLNDGMKDKVCFKSYIGLEDGKSIGDLYTNDDFKARKFSTILESDENRKLENNSVLYEPIAAVNGDYVDTNDAPMDINFSGGVDYSGSRASSEKWTSIVISQDNEVEFSTVYNNASTRSLYETMNYNVVGGGPRLAINEEGTVVIKDICKNNPRLCGQGDIWYPAEQPRTIVGITDKNFMIILVGKDISANDQHLYDVINRYAASYGTVMDANLFDGGGSRGSPSLMYRMRANKNLDEDIKQEGTNDLSSLLLMYTGDACL